MLLMSIIAIHHRNTTNLGDLVCSPCQYVDFDDVEYSDARAPLPAADNYIFGGGAIFRRLYRTNARGVKIAWGVGQTNRKNKFTLDGVPEDFELFGSRDVGQVGAQWVPCASCMSPLFDREYKIAHEAVGYWNFYPDKTVPKPRISGIPTEVNRCSFERAVEFLGSGKRIVTNSYHGAYWGTLLGREVVIANPYSSKFFCFKHQPATVEAAEWRVAKTRIFPEALTECREANSAFYEQVKNALC
jgi:hypothetical protein